LPLTGKVLVVDSDRELLAVLVFTLRRAGLRVIPADDGPTGLALLASEEPDVVVLRFDPANRDDVDLLQAVRRRGPAQILLLAEDRSEDARVRGLELGADDCLVKPFSFRELAARLRARLRRAEMLRTHTPVAPPSPLRAGELVVDMTDRTASYAGRTLHLTRTELRLLACLLAAAGTVVPTRVILQDVWGREHSRRPDVVRVTATRLRRKLEEAGARDLLGSVRGSGFILRITDPR
jgi:DNA-binding response OmpR family regulator